jgi:AcrR family transcriptional regulator
MPTKAGAPGPRDERGVLAARILREARVAFAASGWAGTTVRAVARAADVDPALIYHYFGSKEGLLDAATTLQTAFHEPTTREKLRDLIVHVLMGSAAVGAGENDRLVRSGLVASQLLGFALMRYVRQIEPIASMRREQVLAATTPNLQRYIDGDLSPLWR